MSILEGCCEGKGLIEISEEITLLVHQYDVLNSDDNWKTVRAEHSEFSVEYLHNTLQRLRSEIHKLENTIRVRWPFQYECLDLFDNTHNLINHALTRTHSMISRDLSPLMKDWPPRLIELEKNGETRGDFQSPIHSFPPVQHVDRTCSTNTLDSNGGSAH